MPSLNDRGVGTGDDTDMVGKSKDPKGTRITVRISEKDLQDLQDEARRRNITVGAVVRLLIRERLHMNAAPTAERFSSP
jgi:hypothetical protein